jgi:hypothetical protein
MAHEMQTPRVADEEALRRRREASDRLPLLAAGIRDPLDDLAGIPVVQVEYTTYDVSDLGLNCTHESEECPGHFGLAS